jgi:acyl-coenzyme A synthetase/AMP-(fatty) acid ligase
VVNFLTAMRERPGITPNDVLVAVTTLSFDIAVLELFLPLTVGATAVIATREVSTDGAALGRLLESENATMMQATPATWRLLFDAGWTGRPKLRALCGGEALPIDLANRLQPAVLELWNMYGPTETTVWSTCVRIEAGMSPIPIGSPIGNTVLRIIDRFGRPAPSGVPGELLIGGAGVAKGYLGRPELTAERFIPDPTGERPEMMFYKTGDLVRIAADSQLQHLGRLDHQVKVRGYRVELGEIETVLASLPDVSEAVASAHVDATGDVRLVAYVVYREGKHPTTSEVRRQLRDQLPGYMVPGLVVRLEKMPRTPNGKVDRNALPNPLPGIETPRVFAPPASPAEQIVADTWRELLAVPRVGRHDNFFELGGHSLLSMRAVATIAKRTGKRLDPRLMFFQTVEQIAAHLNGHGAETRS